LKTNAVLALALIVPVPAFAQPIPSQPPTLENVRVPTERPMGPRTLPFVEGERVPPGYVLAEHANAAAIAGGASVFGLAYVITLLVYAVETDGCGGGHGPCEDGLWPLWFPAFGPLLAIGTARADGGVATALLADGVVQAFGVGLVIYGLATEKFYWLRADLAAVRVTPIALDRYGRGLVVSVRF
jgi:hypothetical protein